MISIQLSTNNSCAPEDTAVAAAPSMECMHLVLAFVHIMIEWKIRSVHDDIDVYFESKRFLSW